MTACRNTALPLALSALLLLAMSVTGWGQDKEGSIIDEFNRRHQVGVRLGAWVDIADETQPMSGGTQRFFFDTDFSDGNLYVEGYFAYRLYPQAMVEFSGGVVSRGDVTFVDSTTGINDIGTLLIYPFLLKLKLYPLASFSGRLQPYFSIGGGIYYGRQNIQFSNDPFAGFRNTESGTDFNYAIGGGFDWLLTAPLALELSGQYLPVRFDESLVNLQDYQAFTLTVGLKYLLPLNKKKE